MSRALRRSRRSRRGQVLLTVLILMMVLVATGGFVLASLDYDQRGQKRFRSAEILSRGAEAGAAHRLSEVAVVVEPIAILDEAASNAASTWNTWPTAGSFTTTNEVDGMIAYRTLPVQLLWQGKTPPPGVAVGTNTYVFEVVSYAVGNTNDGGESAITVGFKSWDLLPSSYGP
jgi:hypothetical protein